MKSIKIIIELVQEDKQLTQMKMMLPDGLSNAQGFELLEDIVNLNKAGVFKERLEESK